MMQPNCCTTQVRRESYLVDFRCFLSQLSCPRYQSLSKSSNCEFNSEDLQSTPSHDVAAQSIISLHHQPSQKSILFQTSIVIIESI